MLDIEAGIVVGLEQPGVHLVVDEDVDPDYMEAVAFLFGEGCVVVVF